MKKIYNTPDLEVNVFDIMDVTTLSGGTDNGSMMEPVSFEDLFKNN